MQGWAGGEGRLNIIFSRGYDGINACGAGSLVYSLFFFFHTTIPRKWKVRKSSADPLNLVRRPMGGGKNMRTALAPRFLRRLSMYYVCWAPIWNGDSGKTSSHQTVWAPRLSQCPQGGDMVTLWEGRGIRGPTCVSGFLLTFRLFFFFALFLVLALTSYCPLFLLGSHSLGPLFTLSKHTRWGDLAVCVRT